MHVCVLGRIYVYIFYRQEASQMPRIASPLPCWCPVRFITFLFIDSTDATFCRVLENQPVSPSPAPAANPPPLFVPQRQSYITSFNIASTACIIHSTAERPLTNGGSLKFCPVEWLLNFENRLFQNNRSLVCTFLFHTTTDLNKNLNISSETNLK